MLSCQLRKSKLKLHLRCTRVHLAPRNAAILRVQAAIEQLDLWARQAEADIALVEALSGAPLAASECVADVLPRAVHTDAQGNTVLSRCVLGRWCRLCKAGLKLPRNIAGTRSTFMCR